MTALALGLLGFVAYTYVGYPLLVALWARVLPRRAAEHGAFEPTVSVCMAVNNGADYLEAKLESFEALDYPRDKLEFLVCSDGSTDATHEVVARHAESDARINWLENPTRAGKPAALNRLRAAARGEVIVLTDVRQPIAPSSVRALVRGLSDPSVGCVSGNLVLSGSTGAGAYWRYERFIRQSEGRIGGMSGVSGALYAVRRADMPRLPVDVINDDMFVPLRIALAGKRIVFEETARAYDRALDDEHEFSRKVRTLAGNYQLLALLPRVLWPRHNRAWFSLISHKLARLACPFALAALFLLSVAVVAQPDPRISPLELGFFRALLFAQTLVIVLAALGPAAGRLGTLARTFVVLNAAVIAGLWRFVRGRQAVTW